MLKILHNKTANAISAWVTIVSIAMGALSWVTPEWFGKLTWAQATLTGIAGMLLLSIILSAALALGGFGFRLIKPLPKHQQKAEDGADFPDFARRVTELENLTQAIAKAGLELPLEIASMAESMAKSVNLAEKNANTQNKMNALFQKQIDEQVARSTEFENLLAEEKRQIEEFKASYSQGLEIITRRISKLNDSVNYENETLRESLYAIYLREQMTELAASLDSDAEALSSGLHDEQIYDHERWQEWEVIHSRWEAKLRSWASMGKGFAPKVETLIFTIDDAKYSNGWTVRDDQFPNAEAVRRYKRHRIIVNNWQHVRLEVENGCVAVAFKGLRSNEVRHG